jgi:7-cyano-7-deazaguanine synthase
MNADTSLKKKPKHKRVSIRAKAVVLLSGGLDSATTLYYALSKGYDIFCLSFDYGQRHKKELNCARYLASLNNSKWQLVRISFPWKGSSLLDKRIKLPRSEKRAKNIPNTYVPSRNIIFLSYAVSYAEVIGADKVFIGVNQIDYSGYPDCRSSFLSAFEVAVNKGTKRGVNGKKISIISPLLRKNKKDIINMGSKLRVPFQHTWSCYKGERVLCGKCDSCLIREKGFIAAGIKDPLKR